MLWLVLHSARQNARKYWLAIIGVAAAVLVATLGISGSQAIWRMAQYPLLQVIGGDLMVAEDVLTFEVSGPNIHSRSDMGDIARVETDALIRAAQPGARTSATLMVPAIINGKPGVLQARSDGTESWLYMPRVVGGEPLDTTGADSQFLASETRSGLKLGDPVTVRIGRALFRDGELVWSLADGAVGTYAVTGVYGQPDPNGNAWVPLPMAQRQTDSGDRVTWVGLRVDDPARLADTVARIEAEIATRGLPLQVITARDMAGWLIADYARLESLSGYYVPAMCLIAVLIVVATGLALATNRRRELALLRSIGLSMAALRTLFVGECMLVVAFGAAGGTVLAALATSSIFRYSVWNPLPALTVLAAAVILAVPCSFALFSRSGALRALRNP